MHRFARAMALVVALVAATAACQMNVTLRTTVARDGSGSFSLRFVADKELVDLARTLPDDPLGALGNIPAELRRKGWTVRRTTPSGGLQITIERRFEDPADLNRALEELARGGGQGPNANFYTLKIDRSSSFLRTRTTFSGTIDLSLARLLGESSLTPDNRRNLQSQLEQTAGQFFRFTLETTLPGRASSTSGDPEKVDGGRVFWSSTLGRRLNFAATTSAYSPTALSIIGAAVVLIVSLLAVSIVRRRRRVTPREPSESVRTESIH